MAQMIKQVFFDDFLGGVNDQQPKDKMAPNEALVIKNMLPVDDNVGLGLRTGFEMEAADLLHNHSGFSVFSLFEKRVGSTTYFVAAIKDAVDVRIVIYDGSNAGVNIHDVTYVPISVETSPLTGAAASIDNISFVGWDSTTVLFSDGVSGLYVIGDITSGGPTFRKVINKNGIDGNLTTAAPYGLSLTQHRGRIWSYSGDTVSFCGTDRTSDNNTGTYENWLPYNGTDADETIIDDGNSMVIPPYGTDCTGIASSVNGLYVFKEDSIALWNYPDAAAPWEVDQGATIDVISNGIGCVDSDTIGYYRDSIFFIGNSTGGRYSVHHLNGTDMTDIGSNIYTRLATLKSYKLHAKVVGDYYLIMRGIRVMYALNIPAGAWYDIESYLQDPPLATPATSVIGFTAMANITGDSISIAGSDGNIWKYPSAVYLDGGRLIPHDITTQTLSNQLFKDMKARLVYLEGGSLTSDTSNKISYAMIYDKSESMVDTDEFITIPAISPKYDDGSVWGTIEVDDLVHYSAGGDADSYLTANINKRAKNIAVRIFGTSDSYMYINKVGIGFRGRTGKN
jgi:hypothetical protein